MTNIQELISKSKSMEETNDILKENNLPSYEDAFSLSFRIKKKHFFEVVFGDLKAQGQQPYFATSGCVLNYIRSDYNRCGQCQHDILQKGSLFYKFFEKWDVLHTKSLTMEQFNELKQDIEELKEKYDYVESNYFHAIVKFDREMSK